jgi:hypothetical protein
VVQQPQVQSQVQYELPIQEVRFATKQQADAFMVFPNTRVLLIDKESGIAHLKMADNMGQPSTQYFKFEAINADGTPFSKHKNKKHKLI